MKRSTGLFFDTYFHKLNRVACIPSHISSIAHTNVSSYTFSSTSITSNCRPSYQQRFGKKILMVQRYDGTNQLLSMSSSCLTLSAYNSRNRTRSHSLSTSNTTSTTENTKQEDSVESSTNNSSGTTNTKVELPTITIIDEEVDEAMNAAAKKAAMLAVDEIDRTIYTEEVKVCMPDISDGHGKVIKWYKQEGDIVQWEDVLCDIETEDFTFGMETDDEHLAIMGKILVEAPSGPIKANEVICILLHPKDDKTKSKDN